MNRIQSQALVLLFGLACAGAVSAASDANRPAGLQPVQNVQSVPKNTEGENFTRLITELSRLERRLADIQRDAIVQNPQLRTEARELQSLLVETMQAEGYSPTERLQRIQEIQSELSNPELNQTRRSELIAEAQTEQQELSQAEQAALQHQEVQEAARAFEDRLVQAMREQDPNAERLLEEYESRSEELQAVLENQPGMATPQQ